MSNPSITLGPSSGSREIQMHTDAQIRLDGTIDPAPPRDLADTGRMCQTFERETDDDLVWRPPLLIVLMALCIWGWAIFEIYQIANRAPGLFE